MFLELFHVGPQYGWKSSAVRADGANQQYLLGTKRCGQGFGSVKIVRVDHTSGAHVTDQPHHHSMSQAIFTSRLLACVNFKVYNNGALGVAGSEDLEAPFDGLFGHILRKRSASLALDHALVNTNALARDEQTLAGRLQMVVKVSHLTKSIIYILCPEVHNLDEAHQR